jgi:hypothetical protein
MKIMLRADIMIFSIGTGSTHADDTDGYSPTTLFTSIPGEQSSWVAAAAARQAAITIPNGAVVHPVAPATGCSSRPQTAVGTDHFQQQG